MRIFSGTLICLACLYASFSLSASLPPRLENLPSKFAFQCRDNHGLGDWKIQIDRYSWIMSISTRFSTSSRWSDPDIYEIGNHFEFDDEVSYTAQTEWEWSLKGPSASFFKLDILNRRFFISHIGISSYSSEHPEPRAHTDSEVFDLCLRI